MVQCGRCGLAQLDYVVEPKKVFPRHYPYRSGLTNMLVRNFRNLADELESSHPWKKNDLIIDIGSNDGTLLEGFKNKGMRVLGVEPTNAAKVANAKKIPTLQSFFDAKTARQIRKKYGAARIVTATNVFAHIDDAPALAKNISSILDPEGVFVSESQYLLDIVEKMEFDTIYHEHLRFYSLKPLLLLLKSAGLSVIHAERIQAAGGSIRVFATKGIHPQSTALKALIKTEEEAGLYNGTGLRRFAEKSMAARNELLALVLKIKGGGAKIVGLTSAARSNTLLGYSKLDSSLIDYTGEKKGSPKIGLYTPGTHIPVVDESRILKEQPDYVLVLSWHIGKELAKKMRDLGYKGKFIIPLPKPRIVS